MTSIGKDEHKERLLDEATVVSDTPPRVLSPASPSPTHSAHAHSQPPLLPPSTFSGVIKALLANRPLLFVVLFATLGGLLFGYDIGVMGGVIVLDGFRGAFGLPKLVEGIVDDTSTSDKLSWIVSLFPLCCAVTAIVTGPFADKVSRRWTIFIGALIFTVGGLAQALAQALDVLQIGRVLSGLAVGILSTVIPVYVAELASADLRGALNTLFQLAITMGIVGAFLVNLLCEWAGSESGWRVSLGMQSAFSGVLMLGIGYLPESPRLLMKQKNEAQARAVLQRLRQARPATESEQRGIDTEDLATFNPFYKAQPIVTNIDAEIEEMRAAIVIETREGEVGWLDLLRAKLRVRLVVGCGIQFCQQLTFINAIMYYSPLIFSSVGIDPLVATFITGIVNVFATLFTIKWIDSVGRVPLLLWSAIGMFLSTALITAINSFLGDDPNAGYLVALFVCTHVASFAFGWGPIGWVYPAEIFPLAARGKAVSLTTATNWLGNFVVGWLVPNMLSMIGVGSTFLVIAVCLTVVVVFTLVMVPETRGRSLERMHEIFAAQSWSQFKSWLGDNYTNNVKALRPGTSAATS